MRQNPLETLDINESVCLNLLNNLPGMFFRCLNDEDRTMLYVSNGCNELTGFSSDEICHNKNISFFALLHPDDRERVKHKTFNALENRSNSNLEFRILCRKGKTKWVREISNGIYVDDELVYIEGYISDITFDREASKLNSMLNTYQNAVNSGSLVSITDPKGVILFANDQFCKYSKYPRKELIGQNHRIVNSKFHSISFFQDMWATLRAGDTWRGEIRNKAKDGSIYWVDTVITPVFDTRHRIIQYLSIRNIITEKKEAEFSLIKKKDELSRAVEEISNRFNEMMQFNYIVSHNLRAPVANILGLTSLLLNKDIDETEKKSLTESVQLSTQKLDEILNDLNLILSSKSKINQAIDLVNLNELLKKIVDTFILSGGLNKDNIIIRIDENANYIHSIKSFIESIFYNLISNAIKYKSNERDLSISIVIKNVLGTIQIEFKDNGIGIDLQKYGDSLFGLYKRFHPKIEGKGIGLHMTKNQIVSLGGTISVESKVGEGTIFYISLPIESSKN